jgi:hypothetical protein
MLLNQKITQTGEEAACKQLQQGLRDALKAASASVDEVVGIAMCMSGINTKKDVDVMSSTFDLFRDSHISINVLARSVLCVHR